MMSQNYRNGRRVAIERAVLASQIKRADVEQSIAARTAPREFVAPRAPMPPARRVAAIGRDFDPFIGDLRYL